NYSALAQRLEPLAAAQGLAELCLRLVPEQAPAPEILTDLLLQLGRLETLVRERGERREALAIAVQGSVHLLELIEAWSGEHLGRSPRAFRLLRSGSASMPPSSRPQR
ncbi:MAG: hypothetical protein ACKOPS_04605, partial [Cyanobium sp.]